MSENQVISASIIMEAIEKVKKSIDDIEPKDPAEKEHYINSLEVLEDQVRQLCRPGDGGEIDWYAPFAGE